jgi:predicted GH43/DUF377 family glycosyl hydrolase
VTSVLNPGTFRFRNRVGLVLRVCERPEQEPGYVSTPVRDEEAPGGVRILRISESDSRFRPVDSRVFMYQGTTHLTTLSHLRLAWSDDGVHFTVEPAPALEGCGPHEEFGVEDCRVVAIEGRFYLTYSAVGATGYGVGLASTDDWKSFTRHGLIFPTPNKDCAILPEKVNGFYYALNRPSSPGFGGHFMWMARSPDLLHWGDHRCVATPRDGMWDSGRIGAGAAPIATPQGWLEIYHGATEKDRYCLGLMLLDRENPCKVIARSGMPILEPVANCEKEGFFGNVVFTNGHVVEGDDVTVYYGAADSVVCGAVFSLAELTRSLR